MLSDSEDSSEEEELSIELNSIQLNYDPTFFGGGGVAISPRTG